jgi:hypothetical protein
LQEDGHLPSQAHTGKGRCCSACRKMAHMTCWVELVNVVLHITWPGHQHWHVLACSYKSTCGLNCTCCCFWCRAAAGCSICGRQQQACAGVCRPRWCRWVNWTGHGGVKGLGSSSSGSSNQSLASTVSIVIVVCISSKVHCMTGACATQSCSHDS